MEQDPVIFEVKSIGRMYLNVYAPQLQHDRILRPGMAFILPNRLRDNPAIRQEFDCLGTLDQYIDSGRLVA